MSGASIQVQPRTLTHEAPCPGGGTEVMPVKDSHTYQNKTVDFGQWPRPLQNRYYTPERALFSVGEWPLHISGLDQVWNLLCT
jgi:hypothetical protein